LAVDGIEHATITEGDELGAGGADDPGDGGLAVAEHAASWSNPTPYVKIFVLMVASSKDER
jgi:hypothetical protein